jgi:hypothetical protein
VERGDRPQGGVVEDDVRGKLLLLRHRGTPGPQALER